MPRFDGTGPTGQGPMTGRGMGPCAGGYGCPYAGFCPARRGGRFFGFGRRFFASPVNNLKALQDEDSALQEEIEALKAEREALKKEIEAVKKEAQKQ
ncbi:DUF5320 domain-containing protein [Candidatus Saccharibacteria bacterium]|nr:DUF5320 domain-containing protein [Candidatus Saccharibacteria bacterium]HPW47865.1 DUF5320 domain-containing protein [Candidatus Saccharibacteria bacterium]